MAHNRGTGAPRSLSDAPRAIGRPGSLSVRAGAGGSGPPTLRTRILPQRRYSHCEYPAAVQPLSPTTYALLGLLGVRPWTGYELTNQLRRSLRFVWPSSEGHLYREQKRLIDLGWASVTREPVGKRHRNLYTITPAGREALRAWLGTEPAEPRLEIEALVRMFYGDQSSVEDMVRSIETSSRSARAMLDTLLGFVEEYLEPGGPLSILESGLGGDGHEPPPFHGRQQFPERLHVVALVLDVTTALLGEMEASLNAAAEEARQWRSTTDTGLTPMTRKRLEKLRDRHRRGVDISSQRE
jgi:PadR family transcriptional regulator AphA